MLKANHIREISVEICKSVIVLVANPLTIFAPKSQLASLATRLCVSCKIIFFYYKITVSERFRHKNTPKIPKISLQQSVPLTI